MVNNNVRRTIAGALVGTGITVALIGAYHIGAAVMEERQKYAAIYEPKVTIERDENSVLVKYDSGKTEAFYLGLLQDKATFQIVAKGDVILDKGFACSYVDGTFVGTIDFKLHGNDVWDEIQNHNFDLAVTPDLEIRCENLLSQYKPNL